ncbi:MAG TPA: M50 family metallopeptidase [Galbitalea sp.]|nr:M50 family metallopeptidase [Galbitalea sp.]
MSPVVAAILAILFVAFGVLVSILLHEAGHFVFAKLFKVRVGQFMVGFGKTLWSRTIKGTEFGIKAIPLGGYISMAGMYPPTAPGRAADGAEAGSGYRLFQTLVQDARSASADTIEPGYEDAVFYKLPIWKRIIIMLGGPVVNFLIGIALFAIIITGLGAPALLATVASVPACVHPATSTSTVCDSSDAKSPAAKAGFKPGDKVLSVNGTSITSWAQLTSIIRTSIAKPLAVVVERSGREVTLHATPISNAEYVLDPAGNIKKNSAGDARVHDVGYLGIDATEYLKPLPASDIMPQVWSTTTSVGGVVINLPARLVGVWNAAFSTAPRDPNGPIGLIGVGRIAGQIGTDGSPFALQFEQLLAVLASLNIALFVFNLIPLPPLDGGHIIAALWEGLKRGAARIFHRSDPGPVDTAKIIPLTFAVVVVLVAMTVLLGYADIVKPITLQ